MKTASIKTDEVDDMLLSRLATNGKATYKELAKEVGISAPSCFRRVKRLEKLGIIICYTTTIDWALVNRGISV